MLRDRLPNMIQVTAPEKTLLLRAGKKLASTLKGSITIVSTRTFARWLNRDKPRDNPARFVGAGAIRRRSADET